MYETPELETETFTRSSAIKIYSADDFEGMRIAGRLVAEATQQGMLRVPLEGHEGSGRWGFGAEDSTVQAAAREIDAELGA